MANRSQTQGAGSDVKGPAHHAGLDRLDPQHPQHPHQGAGSDRYYHQTGAGAPVQPHWGPGLQPSSYSVLPVQQAWGHGQPYQCQHEKDTKYGGFGIIMAIALFPVGLICLFMDRKKVCSRCGVRL